MGSDADTTEGEVVYLLAELQCDDHGPVLEIGSRARVLDASGERLTLAVSHGNGGDVVTTCPRSLVARRDRSPAARRTLRPWLRPST